MGDPIFWGYSLSFVANVSELVGLVITLGGFFWTIKTARKAQALINKIVLWKVNRYAELSPRALTALNRVANIRPKKHRTAEATDTIVT